MCKQRPLLLFVYRVSVTSIISPFFPGTFLSVLSLVLRTSRASRRPPFISRFAPSPHTTACRSLNLWCLFHPVGASGTHRCCGDAVRFLRQWASVAPEERWPLPFQCPVPGKVRACSGRNKQGRGQTSSVWGSRQCRKQ